MNVKLIMMMESVRSFFKREEGASAIEYALIAGLIAVVIAVGAESLGIKINTVFTEIAKKLPATVGSGT